MFSVPHVDVDVDVDVKKPKTKTQLGTGLDRMGLDFCNTGLFSTGPGVGFRVLGAFGALLGFLKKKKKKLLLLLLPIQLLCSH
jgi:hypothetical protein